VTTGVGVPYAGQTTNGGYWHPRKNAACHENSQDTDSDPHCVILNDEPELRDSLTLTADVAGVRLLVYPSAEATYCQTCR
jgi:hypothetical protein